MVKVNLNRGRAILFAENAMKRDMAIPLGKALAYAKASAPKDSGRMAAALRGDTRKVGGFIEGRIGIFNSLRGARRRGEKGKRPTLAQELVWVEGGRAYISRPSPLKPMSFKPKRSGGRLVRTHSVAATPENDFLIRALERVARRYGAGVDEHI